jgi:septum formation protein
MTSAQPHPVSVHPLWRLDRPLVLASGSAIRRQLLENAGLPVVVSPARIDERALEAAHPGAAAREVAAALAAAKALDVAGRHPDHLVLGADQTLALDGRAFHKPVDRDAARAQIMALQGRTHELISAFALARGGALLHAGERAAQITMRPLSDRMVARYLEADGGAALSSVGAYQLEKLGAHLIGEVDGDHFTVLGLPMLDVLAALRGLGAVEA